MAELAAAGAQLGDGSHPLSVSLELAYYPLIHFHLDHLVFTGEVIATKMLH